MPAGEEANAQGRPAEERQVRVFISSTFRDMHAERDHLVTVVFPELRERVEQMGFEFFDVDLRWGVPAKDANGETANSWEYCRQWIDRVEPFFVCMLGQRYGWEPEPEQLRAEEDCQLQRENRRSITDMEVRHAVLSTRLKRRSYFYLRASDAPADASEFVDPRPLLLKLERLKREVRSCGRPVRDYPCEWTGSGFVGMDEFGRCVLEDLWSGMLRDERYIGKEVWRQALGADPSADPRYWDEHRPIPRDLWERLVAIAKPTPAEPLDAERQQMDAFAMARLRWFQGRTHELQQLTNFLQSTATDAPRLAVVQAVPGQGKSALLAKLSTLIPQPSTFLITHFVGATERSANVYALVQRLLGELDRSGIPWPAEQEEVGPEPERDFRSLCLGLEQRLGDYAGERSIVILIDALNQLSGGYDLQWLPSKLGPGVRVIVSCVQAPAPVLDSPEQRVLRSIASRLSSPLRVPLGPLTEGDVGTIIVAYLKEYCHELDREHLATLCATNQARNPLYLLVMLNELCTLGGNDLNRIVPARIASMAQDHPDTVGLFAWVLQHLEEAFGVEPLRWWCLYLACGRVGMTSQELTDLLARAFGADGGANAFRIERGLRRYLLRRGPQLDFFHVQLRQAVFTRYGSQTGTIAAHTSLADYFRQKGDPDENLHWRLAPRPLRELTFHLANASRDQELHGIMSQLEFIASRVAAKQLFEQIEDYALSGTPLSPDLAEWRDFLQKHAQRLVQHPAMFVALANHEGFPAARTQAVDIDWPEPWLRTSPERLPALEATRTEELTLRVRKELAFSRRGILAVAHKKALAFRVEKLGMLSIFNLNAMRRIDTQLVIQRNRPLTLVSSPDAIRIAVFYETGRATLYQAIFGSNDWPEQLELLAEFGFHLPMFEDPVAVWHGNALWYQATQGTLASVSAEGTDPSEETFPGGQRGELSALIFSGDMYLLALRDGDDTLLLNGGASPIRRQMAQVTAACACINETIAVAFTDGALTLFDIHGTLQAKSEIRVGIVRGSLGWDGSLLLWMGEATGLMAWDIEESTPRRVQDGQAVFPKSLGVIPRQWITQPEGSMLLATTHSLVNCQVSGGGVAFQGRVESIHGGPIWRAVWKRGTEGWLLARYRRAMLLGRGDRGWLHIDLDGEGRVFAANGSGEGGVYDPRTQQQTPFGSRAEFVGDWGSIRSPASWWCGATV